MSDMATIREGLSYDDVLVEPTYSTVDSRSRDVSLDVNLLVADEMGFAHPIIPANMKDVASYDLLRTQLESGGLAIMHRFQSIDQQVGDFHQLVNEAGRVGHIAGSIGVGFDEFKKAERMVKEGFEVICVDVAHGDHYLVENMVKALKGMVDYPSGSPIVIAGNVATKDGARRLFGAGADIVKVGVGPGSLCTTRIETGCGVPQLTAVMDVAYIRKWGFPRRAIIADGGIKNAGDCVKALCFADMVMVGNLFAGCEEAGGFEGGNYRIYSGSSTHKTSHVEGVRARVPKSGPFRSVLNRLLEGIRSGCSYQGSHNLTELKQDVRLIKISSAGLRESYPHDVEIVSDAG